MFKIKNLFYLILLNIILASNVLAKEEGQCPVCTVKKAIETKSPIIGQNINRPKLLEINVSPLFSSVAIEYIAIDNLGLVVAVECPVIRVVASPETWAVTGKVHYYPDAKNSGFFGIIGLGVGTVIKAKEFWDYFPNIAYRPGSLNSATKVSPFIIAGIGYKIRVTENFYISNSLGFNCTELLNFSFRITN